MSYWSMVGVDEETYTLLMREKARRKAKGNTMSVVAIVKELVTTHLRKKKRKKK